MVPFWKALWNLEGKYISVLDLYCKQIFMMPLCCPRKNTPEMNLASYQAGPLYPFRLYFFILNYLPVILEIEHLLHEMLSLFLFVLFQRVFRQERSNPVKPVQKDLLYYSFMTPCALSTLMEETIQLW